MSCLLELLSGQLTERGSTIIFVMEFGEVVKLRPKRKFFSKEVSKSNLEKRLERERSKKEERAKLDKRGPYTWQMDISVEVDGKKVNIVKPIIHQEAEFYPFGDIKFLQRSNEIKELLKKKQKDTYGVTYVGNEARFCDVPRYDNLFDQEKVYKRNYTNKTDVKEYVKNQKDFHCESQAIFSEYFKTVYDLGYECFDDYVDTRYHYDLQSLSCSNLVDIPRIECGVDGCCYKCYEEGILYEHKLRHGNEKEYPFKCLNDHCLHRCKDRVELKMHMLEHCKSIYPCLFPGCRIIQSFPLEEGRHFYKHLKKEGNRNKKCLGRQLCYICRTMVRNYQWHRKQHPELLINCPYPGCGKKFSGMVPWFCHRESHVIYEMRKRLTKNKYNCLYIYSQIWIVCCHFLVSLFEILQLLL